MLVEIYNGILFHVFSWLVLRSQSFDPSYASHVQEKKEPRVDTKYVAMAEDWCSGADDWFR